MPPTGHADTAAGAWPSPVCMGDAASSAGQRYSETSLHSLLLLRYFWGRPLGEALLRPRIVTEYCSLTESWSPRHVILMAHVQAWARPAAQDTPAAGPARSVAPAALRHLWLGAR